MDPGHEEEPFQFEATASGGQGAEPERDRAFSQGLNCPPVVWVLRDDKSLHCLARQLEEHATLTGKHWGWGYNFDWQTRGSLIPRVTPNIICTTFAANALLDCYEYGLDSKYLDIAVRAVRFLQEGLYSELDDAGACFSYTPVEYTAVHNANLLGSQAHS